jgi:hypothetical protein
LHKREINEIATLESDISCSDDGNVSVDSEVEHENGASEPEPVVTTSASKGA